MTITNYIKERIEILRKEKEEYKDRFSIDYTSRLAGICELQAVLSKIESIQELNK